MPKIAIPVSEYYNKPYYYNYMPESIFNSLEMAFLNGFETAYVLEEDFIDMNNKILANHGIEKN